MKINAKLGSMVCIMLVLVSFVICLSSCGDDDTVTPAPLPHQTNKNVKLDSGLVAHYLFTNNYADQTGNFPGQSTNNVNFATDRFGNNNSCMELDGLDGNQHVWIEDSIINLGKNYTLSYWLYLDTIDAGGPSFILTSRFNKSGQEQGGPDMSINPKFTLIIRNGNGGQFARVNQTDALMAKKWYHIVVVQENDVLALYMNKQLIGKDTIANFNTTTFPAISYWAFGSAINNSNGIVFREMDGRLDDIRFYNRAVIKEEIDALNVANS